MGSVPLLLVGLLALASYLFALHSNSDGIEMVMEEDELFGLFEVMGGLLEDPGWAQAHPQPCTDTPWPGVQCEISHDPPIFHVTKIHIGPDVLSPPCKSSAHLSESLLKLPFLKTLSIINCFVTSPVTLPTTLFGTFSSLEHLALQSNPTLYGEIPQSLGEVASLRVLKLVTEQLTGTNPQTNCLIGRMPQDFGKLKRLVLLDLSHNFINGPIPENLSDLEVLEYLLIDDNPIKTGVPLFVGHLKKLTLVSFSGCGLDGPIPNSLTLLKNLTALALDNNSLNGSIPSNLGSLPNLDQLNLSHNKLSGMLQLPEDFIERLGKRLDVKGNTGLCISNQIYHKNISLYLELPACLNSTIEPRNGNSLADETPEDNEGLKPHIGRVSSISASRLGREVFSFSLVVKFVFCFLEFF
ncbi:Leucine-rich repeat receptor-like protein kinase family protein [Quillaja saponaria]|uniref:Leucine-rich repeat receptor-like protein kinase family protein n=1 Tax=Quillaja saponaria TaxID=32244 RepID=A0AAD7M2U7_QUISA|nr:Leucine-rich repeat receptor-like protein kinase family protein [Quillaja saponaria]